MQLDYYLSSMNTLEIDLILLFPGQKPHRGFGPKVWKRHKVSKKRNVSWLMNNFGVPKISLFKKFVDDENQQNEQKWWHHLLRSQRAISSYCKIYTQLYWVLNTQWLSILKKIKISFISSNFITSKYSYWSDPVQHQTQHYFQN